jgi:acyl-CoA synthetase (AMP-forming)/AMP-acid ligase II
MSDAPVDNVVPTGHFSRTAGAGKPVGAAGTGQTTAAHAPPPRPFDALSYLEFNAAATPDAPAIWDEGDTRSFQSLRDHTYALIARLAHEGIRPGDVIAVALPNVALYVALEIAVPATGAVLFPLPLGIGHRELASVLERSGAKLLVTDDSPAGRGIAEVVAHLPDAPALLAASDLATTERAEHPGRNDRTDPLPTPAPNQAPADPDRIVQIALTSGTTGLPKLASLSARLKQLTFEGFTTRLRVQPGDRMFPMSPITQGVGEMCLYALRRGAALVMLGSRRFDPEAALTIARDSETTAVRAPASAIRRQPPLRPARVAS